jgi:hypothetical protein
MSPNLGIYQFINFDLSRSAQRMFVSDTLGSLWLASLDFRSLRARSSMVLNKNPFRLAIVNY